VARELRIIEQSGFSRFSLRGAPPWPPATVASSVHNWWWVRRGGGGRRCGCPGRGCCRWRSHRASPGAAARRWRCRDRSRRSAVIMSASDGTRLAIDIAWGVQTILPCSMRRPEDAAGRELGGLREAPWDDAAPHEALADVRRRPVVRTREVAPRPPRCRVNGRSISALLPGPPRARGRHADPSPNEISAPARPAVSVRKVTPAKLTPCPRGRTLGCRPGPGQCRLSPRVPLLEEDACRS